jgi:D-alanyl-D-alanine carboxypeptidase/D-alanyl-D-alanine-endopeptidase (penicillin-binding protein 4)
MMVFCSASPSASSRHARSAVLRIVLALLLCLSVEPLLSQEGAPERQTTLAEQCERILSNPGLKGGIQGVYVQSLQDGRVLYARNEDVLLVPASSQKLFTSAAALNALGPDWRYVTRVLRTGKVDADGTLHGDLYLQGSGDPLLRTEDLDALAQAVRRAGIRRIRGWVFGDGSRFDRQRHGAGWEWDDMPFYYAAPVSGLNVNKNLIRVEVKPGNRVGDPVRVVVEPELMRVLVSVRARTGEKGAASQVAIGRETGRSVITVEGTLSIDAQPGARAYEEVTVEDPTLYAAELFLRRLEAAGAWVEGLHGEGDAPARAEEVARHESLPLSALLALLNKPSDNLVAECLIKTLAAEKTGQGSWSVGRRLVTEWLIRVGLPSDGFRIADGSGLSRHNGLSARSMARLLETMYRHPHGKVFLDSLPIAGVDGTLRNRMKETPAAGNCRAKTGTMSHVSSLCGYVATKQGEMLAFAILMNNHPSNEQARIAQDRIVVLLAGWEQK